MIPRDKSITEAILSSFVKAQRKLSRIDWASANDNLNRAVYELYALGAKDIDVITTFLSRFA